jgi:hypothetical protein
MIFCGDTVFPNKYNNNIINRLSSEFINTKKIINLESLIIGKNTPRKTTQGIALNSSSDIFDFLKELNISAVSMSNNHITDFDVSIEEQKKLLNQNNISSFGAGDDLVSASKPYIYEEDAKKFIALSFGWDVIGCKYATTFNKGVNPMDYKHIFKEVEKAKNDYTGVDIILIFHNNYEFELYPQPAHRQMFFDLIDFGVSAIFCHHPHIVGGCEVYKDSLIFYSLGNFYLPETNYNGYDLKYNDNAKIGLCVDLKKKIDDIKLYWTYKDDENILSIQHEEFLKDSDRLKKLTPFDGLSHDEYIQWFKKNRKKNKLLPIYKNYKSEFENTFNGVVVKYRQILIDTLVRIGAK